MTFAILAFILFGLASTCAMLSTFFLWQEIGEVNRKVSDSEQISYWLMYPGKMRRIRAEYTRLYPSGHADLFRRLFEYAMFLLGVLTIIVLRGFS